MTGEATPPASPSKAIIIDLTLDERTVDPAQCPTSSMSARSRSSTCWKRTCFAWSSSPTPGRST
jgi:hypothetical protein